MGITKSESQTLIDAASKLKGVLCVKRPGAPPRSAKLSAATTVNHAARHMFEPCVNTWHPAILTHSIPA